jgi:membrane fusion protein (multidrug efflux system)
MAPDKPHEPDADADWYGGDIGARPGGRPSSAGGHDRDDDRDDDDGKEKPNLFQNVWVKIGLAAVVALLLLAALIWWLIARNYEDTDDAFIDTHIVHISPQIVGQVTRVYVNDNQLVRAGQPLVEINSADALAKLQQVQAQEAQALTQYAQAIANERASAAQAVSADRDLARYRYLQQLNAAAVAQQQIDQAVAASQSATAQRDASRAQIEAALAQIKVDRAQISAAQLTLGYTHIVSPVDGHVAQRSVATGNYVSPGQDMMAIVPLKLWITANFKETQLALMRVGQPVTIKVDACSGTLRGHVDSIQRGAGQAFAILPPENATGNFVKVVQRVPVKIVLDKLPADCPVGPGMSVEPSVRVR